MEEDYKKKFEEAIEKIKKLKENLESNKNWSLAVKEIEDNFPELDDSDEKIWKLIRKRIVSYDPNDEILIREEGISVKQVIGWLDKHKPEEWPDISNCLHNCKICDAKCLYRKEDRQIVKSIQWTGDNLREVTDLVGLSPKFNEWFVTWTNYEEYVKAHNNIFKIFNEDGSHLEIPVGAWIIRTPDGYNTASTFRFVPSMIKPKFKIGDTIVHKKERRVNKVINVLDLGYILDNGRSIEIEDQDEWELSDIQSNPEPEILEHSSYPINQTLEEKAQIDEGFTRMMLKNNHKSDWDVTDDYNLAWIIETLYGLEDEDKEYEAKCRKMADWLKTFNTNYLRWINVTEEIYIKEPVLARRKDKTESGNKGYVVCYDHTLTPDIYEKYIRLEDINQDQWKPTKAQMEAFAYYLKEDIDGEGIFGCKMVELYKQLKQL